MNGVNHEVEGYIRHTLTKYPDLITIVTGGAETDLSVKGAEIIYDKHLVFEGLREILIDKVPDTIQTK